MRFTAEITFAAECDPFSIGGPRLAQVARRAEALGYDAISFNDHPMPSRKWLAAGGHDAHDPIAVLSFCAAVTTRIRLIPFTMVLPYRNPFLVAKSLASLDVLSGGRAVASVCAGYLRSEFAAMGIEYEERNDRFDEGIAAMRSAWSTPIGTAFEGRYYNAIDQAAPPPPIQKRLPLWIGGNTRLSRERVAQHGDGWAPLLIDANAAATRRTPPLP